MFLKEYVDVIARTKMLSKTILFHSIIARFRFDTNNCYFFTYNSIGEKIWLWILVTGQEF